jgi:hypothetical protein
MRMARRAWATNYSHRRSAGVLGSSSPTYVNKGTTSTTNTANYPASVTNGNLLVMAVIIAQTAPPTVNTPAGWTLMPSLSTMVYLPGSTNNPRVTLFYKQSDGTETGSVALTYGGAITRMISFIFQLSGVDIAGGVVETTASTDGRNSTTDGTKYIGNALTLARQGSLVVDLFFTPTGVTGGMLNTPGAGWTEIFDQENGGAGVDCTYCAMYKAESSPGTTTAQQATPSSNQVYASMSWAFKSP